MPFRTATCFIIWLLVCAAGFAVPAQFDYRAVESEVRAGHYDAAERSVERRLASQPDDFRAHLLMGIILDVKGQTLKAESHLKEAVRLRPNEPAPRVDLGKFEAEHGYLSEAAADFGSAIRLDSRNPNAHYNLAVILARQDHSHRALAEFQETTKLAPQDYDGWIGLFRAELSLHKYNAAQTAAQMAVKLARSQTDAVGEIGALQANFGDYRDAIKNLQAARSRAPQSYAVLYNLGLAYYRSGSKGQALEVLEGLAAKQPTAELEDLLGDIYEDDRKFVRAARSFERASQMSPQSEQFRLDFILELLAHHNFDAAIFETQSSLRDFPRSMKLLMCLGVADFGAGRYKDAESALLRSIALFPEAGAPLYLLLQLEQTIGSDFGDVSSRLEQYRQRHPDQFWPYYFLGINAFRKASASGQKAEYLDAESLLRQCLARNSSFTEGHFLLGDILFSLNDWRGAIREYRKTAQLDPKMAKAHYRLAISYRRAGQLPLADAEVRIQQQLTHDAGARDLKAQQVETFVYQLRR